MKKFIIKWFIPNGFIELFANDKLFDLDSISNGTYIIYDSKKI